MNQFFKVTALTVLLAASCPIFAEASSSSSGSSSSGPTSSSGTGARSSSNSNMGTNNSAGVRSNSGFATSGSGSVQNNSGFVTNSNSTNNTNSGVSTNSDINNGINPRARVGTSSNSNVMSNTNSSTNTTAPMNSASWESESGYWRNNFNSRPYYNNSRNFNNYEPAYRYGYDLYVRNQGRPYSEIDQTQLSRGWDSMRGNSGMTWSDAQSATRDAYDRLSNSPNASIR